MSDADKLEITELLYRYAELIDAGDFDGVGQLLARRDLRRPRAPDRCRAPRTSPSCSP